MKFNGVGVYISPKAKIGANVRIGDRTIVYDNVEIGDNTTISNDCVLGEPINDYYYDASYENPPLIISNDSLIRSHSIFYAGSEFGSCLQTGHRVTVREYTKAGHHCSFGSYVDIQGYCIMGNYVRMHSYVNIGQQSEIGNYVFFYPFVVLTNDPTPPSNKLVGVKIGDYSQILTSTVMLPGAVLGENCMTAANSTVGGVFEDDSFISGTPGVRTCRLSKAPFFNIETHKRHYPWPKHFERGMPWAGMNFDDWKNAKNK